MKNSIRKLALRKETVRMMVSADLAHVIAGLATDAVQLGGESKDKQCPLGVAVGG